MFQNHKPLDSIFNALANQHRREIIYVLGLQPQTITQLASMQSLSLPAIHKHITILENSKLINRKKTGRTNYITLNRSSLKVIHEWVMEYNPFWGNDTETLENYHEYLKGGEDQ